MPLSNRVDPFGALFATTERGAWMGNRGGRFHCVETRTIKGRPYASRQWICCRLSFKDRRRSVWSQGYTELFFSDDFAALAAGHRPCFECRRTDAVAFAASWGAFQGTLPPNAPDMDRILHQERSLVGDRGKLHLVDADTLPNGAMVVFKTKAHVVRGGQLMAWSFQGYGAEGLAIPKGKISAITSPSVIGCLRAGYQPIWS